MIKAGIIGATGYAGEQLTWILHNHPEAELKFLCSHSYSGNSFENIYRNYAGIMQCICINEYEAEERFKDIDVLFTALPSGKAFNFVKKAVDNGIKVIDLGADFRLKSKETYEKWYGIEHLASELLPKSVYGLPEINRERIKTASIVANPGCYPTATILALAPLVKNELVKNKSIIVDAESGVSGAGRAANLSSAFCECNESVKAYGVTTHRHTPEIEQILSDICNEQIVLTFTPHLVPMNRGILSTCYGNLSKEVNESDIMDIYKEFYKEESFVKVTKDLPETRWVRGSNYCHIGLRLDLRTGRIIIISAIDNLMKGAAGQAVQNMNIMFGLEETMGLGFAAVVP